MILANAYFTWFIYFSSMCCTIQAIETGHYKIRDVFNCMNVKYSSDEPYPVLPTSSKWNWPNYTRTFVDLAELCYTRSAVWYVESKPNGHVFIVNMGAGKALDVGENSNDLALRDFKPDSISQDFIIQQDEGQIISAANQSIIFPTDDSGKLLLKIQTEQKYLWHFEKVPDEGTRYPGFKTGNYALQDALSSYYLEVVSQDKVDKLHVSGEKLKSRTKIWHIEVYQDGKFSISPYIKRYTALEASNDTQLRFVKKNSTAISQKFTYEAFVGYLWSAVKNPPRRLAVKNDDGSGETVMISSNGNNGLWGIIPVYDVASITSNSLKTGYYKMQVGRRYLDCRYSDSKYYALLTSESNTQSQVWYVDNQMNGHVTISNALVNKALEAIRTGVAEGRKIILRDVQVGRNQKFKIFREEGLIKSAIDRRMLLALSSDGGVLLKNANSVQEKDQKWSFQQISYDRLIKMRGLKNGYYTIKQGDLYLDMEFNFSKRYLKYFAHLKPRDAKSRSQVWRVEEVPDTDGHLVISSLMNNKALDYTREENARDEWKIAVLKRALVDNQKFSYSQGMIRSSVNAEMVMTSSDGNKILLSQKNGRKEQQWSFEPFHDISMTTFNQADLFTKFDQFSAEISLKDKSMNLDVKVNQNDGEFRIFENTGLLNTDSGKFQYNYSINRLESAPYKIMYGSQTIMIEIKEQNLESTESIYGTSQIKFNANLNSSNTVEISFKQREFADGNLTCYQNDDYMLNNTLDGISQEINFIGQLLPFNDFKCDSNGDTLVRFTFTLRGLMPELTDFSLTIAPFHKNKTIVLCEGLGGDLTVDQSESSVISLYHNGTQVGMATGSTQITFWHEDVEPGAYTCMLTNTYGSAHASLRLLYKGLTKNFHDDEGTVNLNIKPYSNQITILSTFDVGQKFICSNMKYTNQFKSRFHNEEEVNKFFGKYASQQYYTCNSKNNDKLVFKVI